MNIVVVEKIEFENIYIGGCDVKECHGKCATAICNTLFSATPMAPVRRSCYLKHMVNPRRNYLECYQSQGMKSKVGGSRVDSFLVKRAISESKMKSFFRGRTPLGLSQLFSNNG